MLWLLILALTIPFPMKGQPLQLKPVHDPEWGPCYKLSGDPVELGKFLEQVADIHCPGWRTRQTPSQDIWYGNIQLARIKGEILFDPSFVRDYFIKIPYFKKQIDQTLLFFAEDV